jgi:UDP-N-acetylglucosamine 2-epimerase
MKRVLSVVGTRPEAIKMAPVIKRLAEAPWCESRVVATAQHRELLDQVFSLFRISADIDLDIMRERQTLAALTARLFERLDGIYDSERPDMVLAQGDTTTVMVASLAAFYRGIAFGHVEAGPAHLRPAQSFPGGAEPGHRRAGRHASLRADRNRPEGPVARRRSGRPHRRDGEHGHRRAAGGRSAGPTLPGSDPAPPPP